MTDTQTLSLVLRRIAALLTVTLLAVTSSAGQGGSSTDVTLTWDRNPESDAAGYYVYVGRVPGVYGERVDVGNRTTFTYRRPADGQRYYFAVAAYTSAGLIGPQSEPISHVGGTATPANLMASVVATGEAAHAIEPVAEAPKSTTDPKDAPTAPDQICVEGTDAACHTTRRLLRTASTVSSIAVTPAGQVLAIEDGRHILIYELGTARVQRMPAPHGRTLLALAVDPLFEQTHFVYVAEGLDLADRTREIAIVRYRDVQGTLGDPVAIVSGIRIPLETSAPFTVAGDGHLYIATPRLPPSRGSRDPYSSVILRFTRAGTVPADSRGFSPVFSEALSQPLSLGSGQRALWITGTDESMRQRVGHLTLTPGLGAWAPRLEMVPLGPPQSRIPARAKSPNGGDPGSAWLLTPDGHLARCHEHPEPGCLLVRGSNLGRFTAVTPGRRGFAYAAAVEQDGVTALLELRD